ncbi:MAG: nucleotidyltransferase family protein [Clostridia bacterium]|nr:nucleotidyltransferase family protein [Clostridia bacterium]
MMTNEQKYLLSLIRKSMGKQQNNPQTGSEALDTGLVADMIRKNGILMTVFPVIMEQSGQSENTEKIYSILLQNFISTSKRVHSLASEGETVLKVLGDSGFDCIGLKGWYLRKLYPDVSMRQVTDLDILVRPYDFRRIRKIMEQTGFACGVESNWKHDDFTKGTVLVEMHKRLSDESGSVSEWERRMWDRAVPSGGHEYYMSPEDFYIFHLIHMHTHFQYGCMGLNRLIDTWLLQNRPMNEDYLSQELENIGLGTFRQRMEKLSCVVMGEEEPDDDCRILLDFAFRYGTFGSGATYKAGRIVSREKGNGLFRGKLRSLISAVFLPLNRMKAQYPVLVKWPILLPFYWVKRIAHYCIHDNLRKRAKMLDYSSVSEKDCDEMRRFLDSGDPEFLGRRS